MTAAADCPPTPRKTRAAVPIESLTLAGLMELRVLATALGIDPSKTRAVRDYCRHRKIPVLPDGKFGWVRVADLRKHLDSLAPQADDEIPPPSEWK